jgi:hypothetical protein
VGDCATRPVSAPRHCAAHFRTANAPRPRRGAGRTLEPSTCDPAGSNLDVRPAGAPSPSLSILCGHPRPCCATPRTATTTPTLLSTRGRDAATPATAPRTDHRQRFPRARLETPQSTTTPPPSKPPLFKHMAHRDAMNWGKIRQDDRQLPVTVRHTITHSEIVRHACKSLSPWPIKGRRSPPPRCRDTGQRITIVHTLSAFPTILALASIIPLGTWGHASSPTSLVAAPLQAPRCEPI